MDNVWELGLALGLAVDSGLLLAAALAGWSASWRWVSIGAPILVICTAGLPSVVGLARLGWWAYWERRVRLDAWARRSEAIPVEAVRPEPAKETEYDPEAEAWRVALDRFFRAGETAGGFSAGKLSGVAGSDAWPRLVHFYASEAGGNVLRDAGGNTGHTWGHGWTLDRVMLAIGTNRLPRPDMPLPVIAPFVASATQRSTARKSKPAPRTVDGTARAAD